MRQPAAACGLMDALKMATTPEAMTQALQNKLPPLTAAVRRAVAEILTILYYYICNVYKLVTMKIMSNLLKDVNDEWLVQTIATLNVANPIVDRILEDESVQGVVMTNKEGNPIFTNINLQHANTYGKAIQQLGLMTKYSVTEIDPFDEVLVVRLQTKKLEVLAVPHKEFNIAVIQKNRSMERKKIILNI